MDVFWSDKAQVDAVDLGAYLHVVAHTGLGHDVVQRLGYLKDAAAVGYTQRLHGRGDGKTDRLVCALRICHDEIGGKRVQPTRGALHTGVKRLEVYAEICLIGIGTHARQSSRRLRHESGPPLTALQKSDARCACTACKGSKKPCSRQEPQGARYV